MAKEIIEAEVERLFPQFSKAEVKAATLACEWMQTRQIDRAIMCLSEWNRDHSLDWHQGYGAPMPVMYLQEKLEEK